VAVQVILSQTGSRGKAYHPYLRFGRAMGER
jgi:hypothetical protein